MSYKKPQISYRCHVCNCLFTNILFVIYSYVYFLCLSVSLSLSLHNNVILLAPIIH